MINIALCDDTPEDIARTKTMLDEYQHTHPNIRFSVKTFANGASLLDYIHTMGTFDLYFLDVIMPNENGIDVGMKIRVIDKAGAILYLTISRDYAVDAFRTRACDYLMKPLGKAALFDTLDRTMQAYVKKQNAYITIKTHTGIRRVSHRDIVYGELVGHQVHYHLTDGTVLKGTSLRISFRDAMEPLLKYSCFVLCATSFAVNLAYVEAIDALGIKLTGGATLPISRKLKTSITSKWMDYNLKGE